MSAGAGPLRAIETSYAGCRFRSRLEARWAVFFNALGIAWQYEPQGYQCQSRVWGDPDFWYLPDFWLPGIGEFAEVKGFLDENGARKLSDAAACFGHLLVLGEIPSLMNVSGWNITMKKPTCLEFYKGDLLASAWPDFEIDEGPSEHRSTVATTGSWVPNGPADRFIKWMVKGSTGFVSGDIERAFQAARTARFEHGQSGPYLGAS